MSKFNDPLDNIHIASPCPAIWDEMYGDDRKRHCGACKMNVYNLSDMTRREAEDLLVNSEGRLCVRFFRRADGSILTQNCPVGWAAVKQRVSRVATAVFSMIAGLFGGVFAFNLLREQPGPVTMGEMFVDPRTVSHTLPQVGEIKGMYKIDPAETKGEFVNGQVTMGKPVLPVRREQSRSR
jgi:hypothetical protein